MNDNKICTLCKMGIDENSCKKNRSVCKNWYNIKNFDNSLFRNEITASHQQSKIDNVTTRKSNRTLIIGFSNCGKVYLMSHFLPQKQAPIFQIKKSLSQTPENKAETSDENQPTENYENSTVFLMICCYPNRQALSICFLKEDVTVMLIFTI